MFEDIDWNSLGHPDIPELITHLLSDNKEERAKAASRLEDEVVQGGKDWESFDLGYGAAIVLRNEAPELLASSLIKLLNLEGNPGVYDVLYVLMRMLNYKRLHNEGEIYQQRAERVRQIFWNERETFANLLSSADSRVRSSALSILMDFDDTEHIVELYDLIVPLFDPRLNSSP